MTINEIRKENPSVSFYFFENGYMYRGTPWLHQKIKSYKRVGLNTIFIEL